jgi:hypothetical protein
MCPCCSRCQRVLACARSTSSIFEERSHELSRSFGNRGPATTSQAPLPPELPPQDVQGQEDNEGAEPPARRQPGLQTGSSIHSLLQALTWQWSTPSLSKRELHQQLDDRDRLFSKMTSKQRHAALEAPWPTDCAARMPLFYERTKPSLPHVNVLRPLDMHQSRCTAQHGTLVSDEPPARNNCATCTTSGNEIGNPHGMPWRAHSSPRPKHGNEKSEPGTLALSTLAPCDNQCMTSEAQGEAADGPRLLP